MTKCVFKPAKAWEQLQKDSLIEFIECFSDELESKEGTIIWKEYEKFYSEWSFSSPTRNEYKVTLIMLFLAEAGELE